MFICGQMYSTYIYLCKWPEGYRTNMKVTSGSRISEEALETSLRLEKPRGIFPVYKYINLTEYNKHKYHTMQKEINNSNTLYGNTYIHKTCPSIKQCIATLHIYVTHITTYFSALKSSSKNLS